MQNSKQHVFFRQDLGDILIRRVGTSVDNPIHIQVQMIKLGQQGTVSDDLIDFGITLRNPSVKLRARGTKQNQVIQRYGETRGGET